SPFESELPSPVSLWPVAELAPAEAPPLPLAEPPALAVVPPPALAVSPPLVLAVSPLPDLAVSPLLDLAVSPPLVLAVSPLPDLALSLPSPLPLPPPPPISWSCWWDGASCRWAVAAPCLALSDFPWESAASAGDDLASIRSVPAMRIATQTTNLRSSRGPSE